MFLPLSTYSPYLPWSAAVFLPPCWGLLFSWICDFTLSGLSPISPLVPSVSFFFSTRYLSNLAKCQPSLITHSPHIGLIVITKCSWWKPFPPQCLPAGSLGKVVQVVHCLIVAALPPFHIGGSFATKFSYFCASSKNSPPPWSCQIYSSLQENTPAWSQHAVWLKSTSDCIFLYFSCEHRQWQKQSLQTSLFLRNGT